MRKRLTAVLVLVTLLVLTAFVVIRLGILHDLIRGLELDHLEREATVMAHAVDSTARADQPFDAGDLRELLTADERATVVLPGGEEVSADRSFVAGEAGEALRARAGSGGTSVTLSQSPRVHDRVYVDSLRTVIALGLVLAALAGVLGWYAAAALSSPFQKLAHAAGALGRGRFDLDLPTSRVPEVRAIADSLRTSATRIQLQARRDQEFLAGASHRLRTPMTAMRLELEELQLRDDLDQDARATVDRSIHELDRLQDLTAEVFDRARAEQRGSEEVVPLDRLVQQTADAWSLALAGHRVRVSASAGGDLDEPVTPGPLEQVLELVLADLRQHAAGAVTLDLTGSSQQVTVQVRTEAARPGGAEAERPGMTRLATLVDVLGGRLSGDPVHGGVRIWLPRR